MLFSVFVEKPCNRSHDAKYRHRSFYMIPDPLLRDNRYAQVALQIVFSNPALGLHDVQGYEHLRQDDCSIIGIWYTTAAAEEKGISQKPSAKNSL